VRFDPAIGEHSEGPGRALACHRWAAAVVSWDALLVTYQIGQACFRYPMSQNIHS